MMCGSHFLQESSMVCPPCMLHRVPQVLRPHVNSSNRTHPCQGLALHTTVGPATGTARVHRALDWALGSPSLLCAPSHNRSFINLCLCRDLACLLSLRICTGACLLTLPGTFLKLPLPLQGPGLPSGLYEFTMDPATGIATHRLVVEGPADFPVINPSFIGRRELQPVVLPAAEH